jgi:hypothetical protein
MSQLSHIQNQVLAGKALHQIVCEPPDTTDRSQNILAKHYTQLVKRHWNISIWAGFAIVIAAIVSYVPLFVMFPVTRDVPWANYLLFIAGGGLLAVGLLRAFRDPEHYRGKVSGSILGGLSVLLCALFVVGLPYMGRQIPSAESALRVGQPAPSFTLLDIAGKQSASSDLLNSHRAVVLVFYRGCW